MQLALTTESLCNIWNLCFVLIEFIFPFILTVTWVCVIISLGGLTVMVVWLSRTF